MPGMIDLFTISLLRDHKTKTKAKRKLKKERFHPLIKLNKLTKKRTNTFMRLILWRETLLMEED